MSILLIQGVQIAPMPPRVIPRGILGLLAHVMTNKYVDHLPLYRQSQRFLRAGISLATSTLGDWVAKVSGLLTPLQT